MTVYRLPPEPIFPHPAEAEPGGLLAVGGDLSPRRLLNAYALGIFPWYSEGQPILWYSPDPRFVLFPERLHVPRSLKKRIRRGDYTVRLDSDFGAVLAGCKAARRPGQRGTWITRDMVRAYTELHRLGIAHCAAAYDASGALVGGLYGIGFGSFFAGESMFAKADDASKVAFVYLARQLQRWGVGLIDSQVHTDHVERFGGEELPREAYCARVATLVRQPSRMPTAIEGQPWAFDPDFDPLDPDFEADPIELTDEVP